MADIKQPSHSNKTEGSPADLLALARLYEDDPSTGSCFKQENIPQYFNLLLQETEDLKKSCYKGVYTSPLVIVYNYA